MVSFSRSISEAATIRKIFQGEPEAYRIIVEKYQPLVYAVALAQTTSVTMADKVVVDTFEEGYGRLVSLTDPRKLGALLCAIAQQYCEQLLLRRVPNWNKPRAREADATPVDLKWVQSELIEPLGEELASFSLQERQGILLNAFCGFSAKQIAETLKIERKEAQDDLARTRENIEKALLKEVTKALDPEINNRERLLHILSKVGGPEVVEKAAAQTRIGKAKPKRGPLLISVIVVLVIGISLYFGYRLLNGAPVEEPAPVVSVPTEAAPPETTEQPQGATPAEGEAQAVIAGNSVLKGRVVDSRFITDGVAGLTVEASGKKTETDFYGAFEIRGVARGQHDVTVRIGDKVVREGFRMHTEESNEPITIVLDESIPARFQFQGRVFDRVSNAAITTFEVASCKDFPDMLQPYLLELFREQQQPEGIIRDRFVTLGDYTVYVRARGYAPLPVRFSIDENWTGQQVYEFPLHRSATLKLSVYGANELSVGGAQIMPRQGVAQGLAMDAVAYGRTNSMGTLEIYTLPIGIQSFLVSHAQGVARAIVELEAGKTTDIKVRIPRRGSLTGDITLNGYPTRFREFRRQIGGSMVDLGKNVNYISPGQYEILLTPEPVTIAAGIEPSPSDRWFNRMMKKEVTLNTAEATWLDFNFGGGAGSIQGSVTIQGGAARYAYAEVACNVENGTDHLFYNLGAAGAFSLGNLPVSKGELTIYVSDRQADAKDFESMRVLMDKDTKAFDMEKAEGTAYLNFTF